MNYKQNEKINQVKESTLVVGIDIGSTHSMPGHLTGEALSLGKSFRSATAEKDLNLSKHGCSIYRTSIRSWMQS